jgi:glutamate racemase
MRIVAFDSGVGGLSVLAPLFKSIPHLQVHYLGDIANLPYGTKSSHRVQTLTLRGLQWLLSSLDSAPKKDDLCLIACNTASAEALEAAERELAGKISVIGMIDASCEEALLHRPSSISLLATKGTVRSGAYERGLRKRGFTGPIQQIACPLFVPFVEEGLIEGPAIEWVVDRYLDGKIRSGESVILGCTHYPYLLPLLQRKFPACRFIQAGEALLKSEPAFRDIKHGHQSARSALKITVTDTTASREQISFYLNQLGLTDLEWSIDVIAPLI